MVVDEYESEHVATHHEWKHDHSGHAPARGWIRRHPVRFVLYIVLVLAAILLAITVRGILRGERNPLLTWVAQTSLVRGWVESEFHVKYSVASVAVIPPDMPPSQPCGRRLAFGKASVELIGAGKADFDSIAVCDSGTADWTNATLDSGAIRMASAHFDLPHSLEVDTLKWSDAFGEIFGAGGVSISPANRSGSVVNAQLTSVASAVSASAVLDASPPSSVIVRRAQATGLSAVLDRPALAETEARVSVAWGALLKTISAVLPFPGQWSAAAKGVLTRWLLFAALGLLILKFLVTSVPPAMPWRIVAVVAPVVAGVLLALTGSWLTIAFAAPIVAILMWVAVYYRGAEWHQQMEPAVLDVLIVLLAAPLVWLIHWPEWQPIELAPVQQVSVAQFDLDSSGDAPAASLAIPTASCADGRTDRVAISQANLTNLRMLLPAAAPNTLDVARVWAQGEAGSRILDEIRRIQFLPAAWKQPGQVAFCASASVSNRGFGILPQAPCSAGLRAPGLVVSSALDYTGRQARFALDWRGLPESLQANGSVDEAGAHFDNLSTPPGSLLRIAGGSGDVMWPGALKADLQLNNVQAGAARADTVALAALFPQSCRSGPTSLSAQFGPASYSSGGRKISVNGATLKIDRPNLDSLSVLAQADSPRLDGAVSASIPHAEISIQGLTSREPIPQRLDGNVLVSTSQFGTNEPVHLVAYLWDGLWRLNNQPITVWQQVTGRLPREVPLQLDAWGKLVSLANPVDWNASMHAQAPSLTTAGGPVELTLRDFGVDGYWNAASAPAPLHFTSGWNELKLPALPAGIELNEVTALRLATHGEASAPFHWRDLGIALPSLPGPIQFRVDGTSQSLTLVGSDGQTVVLDPIETGNLRAEFPGLQLKSLAFSTAAQVHRGAVQFPWSTRTSITETASSTVLAQPIAANASISSDSFSFALTEPVDTGRLFDQLGLRLENMHPRANVTAFRMRAGWAGGKLAALDAAGKIDSGPLLSTPRAEISQSLPSSFQLTAVSGGNAHAKEQATVSAPGLEVSVDGGKQHAFVSLDASAGVTLAPPPLSPLLARIGEAGSGLSEHIRQAQRVFGSDSPISWNLEFTGGKTALTLDPQSVAVDLKTAIHSLKLGATAISGNLALAATATLADGNLLVDADAPADIEAGGAHWQWNTPLLLALAPQLRPGSGDGELFDSAYYSGLGTSRHGDQDVLRLAVGYGKALQASMSPHISLFLGQADTLAQAEVTWQPNAAVIDGVGDLKFQGVETGVIDAPNPYLDDRLDGEIHVGAKAVPVDRATLAQLLSDPIGSPTLDQLDLSAQIHTAQDAQLPGIVQATAGLSFDPSVWAHLLPTPLRSSWEASLGALQYRNMALDFQVIHGQVVTLPVLLTLQNTAMKGWPDLMPDFQIRILWGRPGDPAPRLRDLLNLYRAVHEK